MPTYDELMNFKVVDREGQEIGEIDHLWQDDATGTLEFMGVKTGWIFGRTHIVPAVNADVEEGQNRVRVPYEKQQIKNAPHIKADHDISEREETQLYDYYGIPRSERESPTGLAGEGEAAGAPTAEREIEAETELEGEEDVDIPLHEERLEVGKRRVPAGGLRLRKVVRTDQVEEPIELRREEIEVERVPATEAEMAEGELDADAFEEQEFYIPAYREEPVVSKETVLTGEVEAHKRTTTEQEEVSGEVRSEDVEVDRDVERRRPDRNR